MKESEEMMNQMTAWISNKVSEEILEEIHCKTYSLEYTFTYGRAQNPIASTSNIVVTEVIGIYNDINLAYISALDALINNIKYPNPESDYFHITECNVNKKPNNGNKVFWNLNLRKLGESSTKIRENAMKLFRKNGYTSSDINNIAWYFDKNANQTKVFDLRLMVLKGYRK